MSGIEELIKDTNTLEIGIKDLIREFSKKHEGINIHINGGSCLKTVHNECYVDVNVDLNFTVGKSEVKKKI